MALKSSYNGEENKMRMSRIAKPRSNSGTPKMSASASSAVLRQQKGPLANAAKQKTATPRSAVLRKSKIAKKRTY